MKIIIAILSFVLGIVALALDSPARAAPLACGATVAGAVTLTTDLVCANGHGLVVAPGAALNCGGHRISGGDRTGQYGIYVRDGANTTVKNCVVSGFEVGIRVRGMKNGTLKQNVSQDNLRYGIELTQGSTGVRVKANQVLDNGDEGIHVSGPEDRDAGHQLVNNVVDGNALEGIYLLRTNGNLIARNTIRDHGAAGIYVKDSDRNAVDRNTFVNDPIHVVYGSTLNVFSDNTIVGQQIRFKEASNNEVRGLIVRAESGRPSVAFEFMQASGNVVADSQALAAGDYDIRATEGSTGNVFTRLTVSPRLDCSVDRTSSVHVTDSRDAPVTCGK